MAYEILMPQLGLTMEEGTVETWLKREGDSIAVGEEILEISTDKLVNVIESEYEGILLKIVAEEGEDVLVKGVLAIIGELGENIDSLLGEEVQQEALVNEEVKILPESNVEVAASSSTVSGGSAARTASGRIKISPLARKTAEKLGVDYSNLQGSGPGGRIRQEDVIKAFETQESVIAEAVTSSELVAASTELKTEDLNLEDGDVVEKMSGMRKVIAERMLKSSQEIPSVTQDIEVRMSKLIEFRKQINSERKDRISINDFIVKAVANVLPNYPSINSSFIDQQLVKRANVHIGVAVSTASGLIVPVVTNAQSKSLSAISTEVKDLSSRARDGGLHAHEYNGSTFTISNLGMFGITSFTPIINQPNVAILGVNKIRDVLALNAEREVYTEKVMTLSLTFDHRVVDGSEAAQFEQEIVEQLENPLNIIL